MSRGGSYGGGQSSLGYLFGSDSPPTPPATFVKEMKSPVTASSDDVKLSASTSPVLPSTNQMSSNNYHRAMGQNAGNFITDRPTTKVQSVPGGDSSLGYLFGDK